MMDTNSVLVERFKDACVDLKTYLHKYHDKITLREESHDTNFGIENLFEIIVSRLINEDNYGIVFSLTIKKQKVDDLKCVELSAIRGDGSFIASKDFLLKHDLSEIKNFLTEFKSFTDVFSKKIVETLEGEYITNRQY